MFKVIHNPGILDQNLDSCFFLMSVPFMLGRLGYWTAAEKLKKAPALTVCPFVTSVYTLCWIFHSKSGSHLGCDIKGNVFGKERG